MCRVVRSAVCVSFFRRLAFSRLIARTRRGDGVLAGVGLPGPVRRRPLPRRSAGPRSVVFCAAHTRPRAKTAERDSAQTQQEAKALSVRRGVLAVIYAKKQDLRAHRLFRCAQPPDAPFHSAPPPEGRHRPLDTMGAAESHTAKKQVNVDEAKAPRRVRPPPATTQPSRRAGVLLGQARRRRRRQARDPAPDLLLEGGLRGRGGHGDLRLLLCRTRCQVPGQVHVVAPAAGGRVLRG